MTVNTEAVKYCNNNNSFLAYEGGVITMKYVILYALGQLSEYNLFVTDNMALPMLSLRDTYFSRRAIINNYICFILYVSPGNLLNISSCHRVVLIKNKQDATKK